MRKGHNMIGMIKTVISLRKSKFFKFKGKIIVPTDQLLLRHLKLFLQGKSF